MQPVNRLRFDDKDFVTRLQQKFAAVEALDSATVKTVSAILEKVKQNGDAALLDYTRRFDEYKATIDDIKIDAAAMRAATDTIPADLRDALQQAAQRVRDYHERQLQESWRYEDEHGSILGQQVTPLERVGVYVPGGKAAYPSSVIMNAVPARVAGVSEVIMTVPAMRGEMNPVVLAAAHIAGVDYGFAIGGAQAVAALAYGTESVPAVDKIVGPGNRYVATAKRLLFGTVGIDMIAGPSEVVIISDGSGNPDWVAIDLFAQAEHDEDARSILISTDAGFADEVQRSMEKLLPQMSRRDIIEQALANNGNFIIVPDLQQAATVSNTIAPEHLQLAVADPESLATDIHHAGAMFLGHYAAEVLGDYCAGPNHVLPTGRTARFSSALGVYDFQKRTSIIKCSDKSAAGLAAIAATLARAEGLSAHADAAEYRQQSGK
ncbi:MAG: histidinol dehydrogenase [Gammaproteobacteria bacterium]